MYNLIYTINSKSLQQFCPKKYIFSAFEKTSSMLLKAHIFKYIYIQTHKCMHKNIYRYTEEERVL